MPRYWVMAPIEAHPSDAFDKVWQFDLANNLISLGFSGLGDVSKMKRDELGAAVAAKWPEKPPATQSLIANMFWAFYHEMSPGDFVIARRGRKVLAGIGRVAEQGKYLPGRSSLHGHQNFLAVTWLPAPRDRSFPGVVFPMHTLSELSEEAFRNFEGGQVPIVPPASSDAALEDPNEFVLEKYLEDFIVRTSRRSSGMSCGSSRTQTGMTASNTVRTSVQSTFSRKPALAIHLWLSS